MISIAICDDDNDFRLLLRDAVYKMIESHGEQAVIEDFSDGQTCLSQLGRENAKELSKHSLDFRLFP